MASQVLVEGAAFGRNIILANCLGAENLGIAASIALGLRLLEMISDVAVDRFLLQASDGDSPELQSCAHGLSLVRGLLVGIAFAAIGYPILYIAGLEDSAGAIAVLGLVPVVRGALHLDHKRLIRDHNARSAAAIESFASLISTAFAWPIVIIVPTFEAIIWISLAQVLALFVGSHLLARRAYRVSFNRSMVLRFLRFGWPLIVGGAFVFGALQGDRLIIAMSCPIAELGRYTVVAQLALTPAMMGVRVGSYVFLPILSQSTADGKAFEARYRVCVFLLTCAAMFIVTSLTLFGDWLIDTIYGSEFTVSTGVIALVALAAALRLLRAAPTLARLAEGDSRSTMLVDFYRIAGLGISAVAGVATGDLVWIVAGASAGEIVALIAAGRLLERYRTLPLRHLLGSAIAISIMAAIAWMSSIGVIWSWMAAFLIIPILLLVGLILLRGDDLLTAILLPTPLDRFRRKISAGSSA
jgi:O-antigen/teichoic acid export membrane protein